MVELVFGLEDTTFIAIVRIEVGIRRYRLSRLYSIPSESVSIYTGYIKKRRLYYSDFNIVSKRGGTIRALNLARSIK